MKGIIKRKKTVEENQNDKPDPCQDIIESIAAQRENFIDRITTNEPDSKIRKRKCRAAKDYTAKILQEVADHCKLIYEEEAVRENSILQQASNMQSAFSFITAGLFVVAQIVTDQLGSHSNLSYKTIFFCFAIITACMLISLIFATIAQSRFLRSPRQPVLEYLQFVDQNYDQLQDESQRIFLSISEYENLYQSLHRINSIRVIFVRLSMWSFYGAVALGTICGISMAIIDGLK